MERPTKSETNKAIIGATPPTAARAALSIKRPATTESAVLNSCWKILVSASGIAKRITREGEHIDAVFLLYRRFFTHMRDTLFLRFPRFIVFN